MASRLARAALVAAAAVSVFVAPAAADFSASDMNAIVSHLAAREGMNAAQQKVADQVAAAAGKTYTSFSKELAAWSKLVKSLQKAFPGDSHMDGLIATLCDDGDGIDDTFFNTVFTGQGTGAAAAAIGQHFTGGSIAKGAKLLYGKVQKHFIKAQEQSDCSKKLKYWSKARKGAEGILKKYPLST